MHAHAHARAREGSVKALRLTLVLTATFTVVEVVGGLVAGSLALLADAAHMLSDNASLGIALFAAWLAGRPAGPSRTFGYRRAEILAALFNGVTLVALSIWIFIEAAERLGDPPEVEAGLMLGIAVTGLVVNLVAARILHRHSAESLNVSAALRHVLADLLGSLGVIVAAVVILTTGWEYADPAVSVLIGVLVLASSWGILRDSTQILLEGSPPGTDVEEVGRAMAAMAGVTRSTISTSGRSPPAFPPSPPTCSSAATSTATPSGASSRPCSVTASGSTTRRCRSTTSMASSSRSRTRREPAPRAATSSPTIPAGSTSTRPGASCARPTGRRA